MQPPHACHWWSRRCEGDLMHEPGPGHGDKGWSHRSCRCKCELSVAVNPIGAGYWRGIRVPRTARLAQSQSWGSLDRTSFNSVSIQVSVAASEVPRSSASVTHTKSAALCRPAIQCTTTQSPCHKVRAMMPKTSPQSRAKSSGLLKETTSSRAPCKVTPFLASGAWPKAETCKATCP